MAQDLRRLRQDLAELGAAGLQVAPLDDPWPDERTGSGAVTVGVHRLGDRPTEGLGRFDILITTDATAPRPWVRTANPSETLARLADAVERQPVAAAVAAQVLRMTLDLRFEDALALESIAYSMLLASEGYRAWRGATPVRQRPETPAPRVALEVSDAAIGIRLTRPARRNAFDAAMRDELAEALGFALLHPEAPPVTLAGDGPAFSAGGDLDEFGQAPDAGWAHMIRVARSPARLVHALGERITARLHGACVGAGIEAPAAAARVVATPDAFFRLPEVSMGLIPGAGGTATIPRRIGRHRTCFMAISGADIDARTALAWGLVDEIAP